MPRLREVNARKRHVVHLGKFDAAKQMKKPKEGQPVCPYCKAGARTSKAGWSDPELGITKDTRLFSAHARGGKRLRPGEHLCPGSYLPAEAETPQTPV